jgi:uncharacterized repeat protein (TIGR03803 family)
MSKLSLWKTFFLVCAFCAVKANTSPAQTFATLYSFHNIDGSAPYGDLVQGADGMLYGTTLKGGANTGCRGGLGCGTAFKMVPSGALTKLYDFCSQNSCTDGSAPESGMIQAADGTFYGTTSEGGANNSSSHCANAGCGTVFKLKPNGALTTVYNFCSQSGCTDGAGPPAALVRATDGNFYGPTTGGGAMGWGTVFKLTPVGTLNTIYSFCSQSGCTDGKEPQHALIQASDGNFYDTTSRGGPNVDHGTVFKMTPGGALTTLYSFCPQSGCTDGEDPFTGLVQGLDGNFYGTTAFGGANNSPSCGNLGCGTVFKMTPTGKLTTLYSFCSQSGCADGVTPNGLVQATDGNFYGTTQGGGTGGLGFGTVFKITPGGALSTLYNFCSQSGCTDGQIPIAALVQDTSGKFYGTTASGGASATCFLGCGTVFSLDVGLGPFVETLPTSGKVGATVIILGNNLTSATSVTFNGTPAAFTASSTAIKTTVPNGATTGLVSVTGPGGTLKSNVNFRVTPVILSFNPTSDPVGTVVTITGNSLTQTQGVGFGDYVPATFTVNSDTQVTATVPAGAKTGPVGIQTPGGIAISSTTFTVTP